MSDTTSAAAQKPKKSVALSGVIAGNTALSSVGRTGNDLHYRGYDILDIADQCEYEEIAHLLVHGKLPTRASSRRCADCPPSCRMSSKRYPRPHTRWT